MNNSTASDNTPHGQADETPFGPFVYAYTRAQALAEGVQVDVSKMAKEAGFKCPVFLTAMVWEHGVKVPEGVTGQDEDGRLWDILNSLRRAVRKAKDGSRFLLFKFFLRNSDARPAHLVTLAAAYEAMDFDDPSPAITVLVPGED